MHRGGQLIKGFDAFLHLFKAAAGALHARVVLPSEDQFELNKVLAGLGGPPAAAEVRLELYSHESLAAVCLFLIMGREHCPVCVMEPGLMAKVKQLTHIVAHTMLPMATGGPALTVSEVSAELTSTDIILRPVVTYNEDGQVAGVLAAGGRNRLGSGPEGGPYKVVINPQQPVALDQAGPLHPVQVHVSWRSGMLPFLQL